jgi:hypothetical protein
MKKNNRSLQKTFKNVKDQRQIVKPNRGFMKNLINHEIKLFGKISLGNGVN